LKFTFTGFIETRVSFINDSILRTEVIDSGIGMKPEEIDKLFRFFGKISSSNHLNRGGMGFGLTITKMILHQLGGSISVESQV
jgi:hypothetical protein